MRFALTLALLLAPLAGGGSAPDRASPRSAAPATRDGLAADAPLLLDDFARDDGVSTLGTTWRRFTDNVMGGRSRADSRIEIVDGRRALRLTGEVSLANNGGFIQVALPLAAGSGPLDATGYRGFRLLVRCAGDGYYLHLRTTNCRLPWQYYAAPLRGDAGWVEVQVPFAAFEAKSLGRSLRPSSLRSIGVVAAERAFTADIAVARLELYR